MSTASVKSRQHGTVLEISLDRPRQRNALSRALLHELRTTLRSIGSDVRAVLLTSTGSVFTAGADFVDLTGTSADLEYDKDLGDTCTAIRTCAVPVFAVIDGACLGAGVELATSCDARVVGPHAWFRVPAVELGLLYNPDSLRLLHRVLPRTTMTRLLVFAERIEATDAVHCGLATHDATTGDAREFCLELADRVAGLPTDAMNATRTLLRRFDEDSYCTSEWETVRIQLMDSAYRHEAVHTSTFRRHADRP